MVALNSTKYIYPFGGSAEKPVVDPDKQIGKWFSYRDISISFAICQYIVIRKYKLNAYLSNIVCSYNTHNSWRQRSWTTGHV